MSSAVGAGQKKGRAEPSPYSADHSKRLTPFFSVVAASLDNRDWCVALSLWLPFHRAHALASLQNVVGPIPASSPI